MISDCKRGLTNFKSGRFLLIVLKLLELNSFCATCLPDKFSNNVRLPQSIVPDSYSIKFIPFMWSENFTFSGEVEILVNVTKNTKSVVLHTLDLSIDESATMIKEVDHANTKVKILTVVAQTTNEIKQFYIIETSEKLTAGKQYVIYMKFIGRLNEQPQGFYRSSYWAGNNIRLIASTQFQPADARRAFPCFDEPSLKAKFQISIARSMYMTSLSNMPRKNASEPVQDMPGYVWDHYESTVRMSTYLVAFVIADFEVLHSSSNNFSIWGRHDVIQELRYPLDIGLTLFNYFEKYFQIKYPLPKLDMVALPSFSAEAMENWGLITYLESKIRFAEHPWEGETKQSIAILVAHELAHQWFGNLVTPNWWTNLWLNEGFATYFSFTATDAIKPKWKVLEQFVVNEMQYVLTVDALPSTHPVSANVTRTKEIERIFDAISYSKAAAIIRMMSHVLTEAVFKQGLINFLNAKAYGSVTPNDLSNALTQLAHKEKTLPANITVNQIINTWIMQPGFPVISVIRNYMNNSTLITQDRFLMERCTIDACNHNFAWFIPLTYTTEAVQNFNNTVPSYWMLRKKSMTIYNLGATADQWIMFNIQQTGYYRVNYDQKNWVLIIKQLKGPNFANIALLNRAQLIDDALTVAWAGGLDYWLALDVTSYLIKEIELVPWKPALTAIKYFDDMLYGCVSYEAFRVFVIQLLDNVYNNVGLSGNDDEPELIAFTRIDIFYWACTFGQGNCVKTAWTLFKLWADVPENISIPLRLKRIIYCTVIRTGGQSEWNFMWSRYINATDDVEKVTLLYALSCTREPWILSRYLTWATTVNSGIPEGQVLQIFCAVAENPVGQPLVFNFLRNQWTTLWDYIGGAGGTISRIIKALTRTIRTEYELKDMINFIHNHNDELGYVLDEINNSVEQIVSNIKWFQRSYQSIENWLFFNIRP